MTTEQLHKNYVGLSIRDVGFHPQGGGQPHTASGLSLNRQKNSEQNTNRTPISAIEWHLLIYGNAAR
jgi:hypothetical protein